MTMRRFVQALAQNLLLLLALLVVYAAIIWGCVGLGTRPRVHPKVDVVFVFDTTNSMQDNINGLLAISSRFSGRLASAGIDARLSMVSFGSLDEPRVIRDTCRPTADIGAFKRFLRGTYAQGGGCEDQPTAVKTAIETFTYRAEAHKIMILITDEPLLGEESYNGEGVPDARAQQAAVDWDNLIARLAQQSFTVYAVCIPFTPYQRMATVTKGHFYEIEHGNDFTNIVMDIADQIDTNLTR